MATFTAFKATDMTKIAQTISNFGMPRNFNTDSSSLDPTSQVGRLALAVSAT
jgi:hypothetical protein